MANIITVKNVIKKYNQNAINEFDALNNVSFDIQKGEFISIVGKSGSGKSTLLNILGLLDDVSSGNYYLDNELVNNKDEFLLAKIRNQKIGFVFQQYNLIANKTILDNVSLPLYYRKTPKEIRNELAKNVLQKVGLKGKEDCYPNQLSGGECQRVSIARAMIAEPKLILADEPTGALDSYNGDLIFNLFRQINQEGVTIVMITHDHQLAKKSNRIIELRNGSIENGTTYNL